MLDDIIKRFPGVGCAYVERGGDAEYEFYGFSDKESGTKVNGQTIFPACSISKFVTAICVMKLSEQGIIHIDKAANRYLSSWKLQDVNGKKSDVSIRHLLEHTAGIFDGEDGFYGHRMTDGAISIVEILEGTTVYNNRPAVVEQIPGTAFVYSDAGFCIIQLLLEDASGKGFADLAKELVFDRLGLKDIFFGTRGHMDIYSRKGNMTTGYQGDDTPIEGKYPVSPDLAASGLWSSPGNLMAIAKDFAASLRGYGGILCQESAREMIKSPEKFPWVGLGLFKQGEDVIVSKGWGEDGQCMLKINYRDDSIAVVMTNKDPEVPQEESGVEQLLDAYLCENSKRSEKSEYNQGNYGF